MGEYGVISVFSEEERARLQGQGALFDLGPATAKAAEEVVPMQPPKSASTEQAERDADALDDAQVDQNADAPDDAQRQIEEAEGGPLVVVAGPGSGKTRVLTRRIARLVASGVDPGQIMAITFTRRAAGQMRQRLSALLDGGLGAMQVGTFHRLALSLLRELGCEPSTELRPKPKLVLDEVEARRLLEGALADAGLSGSVAAASQAISLAKAAAQGPDEIAEEWRPHYDAYQAALHAAGACDYDDILLDLLRLLEGDAAVREQVRARFPYLLIDEFQDLNAAQYRLVLQLAGAGAGLMANRRPRSGDLQLSWSFARPLCSLARELLGYATFSSGRELPLAGTYCRGRRGRRRPQFGTRGHRTGRRASGQGKNPFNRGAERDGRGHCSRAGDCPHGRRHRYGADRCWRRGYAQLRRLCRAFPHRPAGPSAGGVLPQGGPALPTRRPKGLSASVGCAGRVGVCPLRLDFARGLAPLASTRGHRHGTAHFASGAARRNCQQQRRTGSRR